MEKYEQAIKLLIKKTRLIQKKQRIINRVKENLAEYRIMGGRVQELFENPTLLHDADIREVLLFCEQVAKETNEKELNIEKIFKPAEIKEARQYDGLLNFEGEIIDFPITFNEVIRLSDKEYLVTIDVETISKLLDNKLLNYNFEIQREATKVRRKNGFILVPTIIKENVNEIADLLEKGQLKSTMLAFNAAIRTADLGEELTFDHKKGTLTINHGTRLDVLDGMHRCLGSKLAYSRNPNIDFKFALSVTNFSTAEAQAYQRQIAKATQISKTRQKELENDRLSNVVIDSLNSDSELQGRISQTPKPKFFANEIVSYDVLSTAIDREFKMVSRLEAYEVADYLKDFFGYLFGYFPEYFISDVQSKLKESLLGYNKMFLGYVILARRMKENDIPLKNIKNIIDEKSFLRNSKEMEKHKIVMGGRLNTEPEDSIINLFEKIKIK